MLKLIEAGLVAAVMALGCPSALAGTYDGRYQMQPGSKCLSTGMDDKNGAVVIKEGVFSGVEMSCRMKRPVSVRGLNGTLYDMECSGEGLDFGFRTFFMLLNKDELLMARPGSSNVRKRCPRPDQVSDYHDYFDDASSAEIIAIWRLANTNCRGGADNLTMAWCGTRDLIGQKLENSRGYCYGKNDEWIGDYVWHTCTIDSIR